MRAARAAGTTPATIPTAASALTITTIMNGSRTGGEPKGPSGGASDAIKRVKPTQLLSVQIRRRVEPISQT